MNWVFVSVLLHLKSLEKKRIIHPWPHRSINHWNPSSQNTTRLMYSSYFCLFVAGTSSPEEKEVFLRESAVLKLIGEHENIVHLMFDGLKSGTDEATHFFDIFLLWKYHSTCIIKSLLWFTRRNSSGQIPMSELRQDEQLTIWALHFVKNLRNAGTCFKFLLKSKARNVNHRSCLFSLN